MTFGFGKSGITLGSYGPWWFRRSLRVSAREFEAHKWFIGLSGYGKSRALVSHFLQLVRQGIGATLIDPQSDAAEFALATLVAEGVFRDRRGFDRIVYLNIPKAEQAGRYLPYNLLNQPMPVHTMAAQLTEAMHRAFPELSKGAATFDTLLPRCARVLAANYLPINYLERFLIDRTFRNSLLERCSEASIVIFFKEVFNDLRKADQLAYAGSVIRRAQQLVDLEVLRYSFGQPDNVLRFRDIIDSGKSVIINLNLQELDAMRLLGCLFVTGYELAAYSRGGLSPREREQAQPHHVLIDEAPNFIARAEAPFTAILSEARKQRVFLTLAHQAMGQLGERLQSALQNARLKMVFKLDYPDAKVVAPLIGRVDPKMVRQVMTERESESVGMAEQWTQLVQDIEDLRVGQAIVSYYRDLTAFGRFVLRRRPYHVVKVKTLPIPHPKVDFEELRQVEQHYLHTYFRPKAVIEAALTKHQAAASVHIQKSK